MKTYTLKQLEQSVLGTASRLNLQFPLQIDVRPEDTFVVVETPSDVGRRWIFMVDLYSGIVLKVLPDLPSANGDLK